VTSAPLRSPSSGWRRVERTSAVKFADAVYVLHVFQKKSKAGIKTPKEEIGKVKTRLKEAEKHYAEWSRRQRWEGQDDNR
jgi:phage-related protein